MTASLIHKLCPILSTVCASFNFLTSLFINNITQHHFSWSTKISLFRYPSLYCRVQKQVSPKNVSSPCSLSLWNHADQALLFFFLLHFIIPHFALQDMSSNCVQVYILQTDEKLCVIQKSHNNTCTVLSLTDCKYSLNPLSQTWIDRVGRNRMRCTFKLCYTWCVW